MTLGVRFYLGEVYKGDTAELKSALRDRDGVVPAKDIASVSWLIQLPDGTEEGPFEGEVEDNGEGFFRFPNTEQLGEYFCNSTYTLLSGEVRTVPTNFDVIEQFKGTTLSQLVAEEVWLRLEDSFDSTFGGPVLRDFTLSHWDQRKIERFIPETLLEINVQMPPSVHSISFFAQPGPKGEINELMPFLSRGVLCYAIKHLARSYVEQPVPQGAQITYEDRTRYTQAWMQLYQVEYKEWMSMIRLWKRQELRLGHSALLTASKAGRLFFNGNILRSRNIGRGFF